MTHRLELVAPMASVELRYSLQEFADRFVQFNHPPSCDAGESQLREQIEQIGRLYDQLDAWSQRYLSDDEADGVVMEAADLLSDIHSALAERRQILEG